MSDYKEDIGAFPSEYKKKQKNHSISSIEQEEV